MVENSYVYRYSGYLPKIYSIIDSENIYQNNKNDREKFKSIYNILNRRDGTFTYENIATTKIK